MAGRGVAAEPWGALGIVSFSPWLQLASGSSTSHVPRAFPFNLTEVGSVSPIVK